MLRLGRLRSIDTVRLLVLSTFFLLLTLYIFRKIFEGTCLTGTDSMSTIYGPTMQMTYGSYFSAWDYFSSVGFLSYPSPAVAAVNQFALGFLQISASDFAKILLLGSFWLCRHDLVLRPPVHGEFGPGRVHRLAGVRGERRLRQPDRRGPLRIHLRIPVLDPDLLPLLRGLHEGDQQEDPGPAPSCCWPLEAAPPPTWSCWRRS